MPEYAIAVHGGAGDVEDGREAAARAGCEAAIETARKVLEAGGSALDAVCAAVRVLEDDPQFNAGRGAVLNRDGQIEHDAAVMVSEGVRAGACAAVSGVRNPIELARAVMEDGEHVLIVGPGARAFAAEKGVAVVVPTWHVTPRAKERLERDRAKRGGPPVPGTVGAVARDRAGQLAAATSTGGISGKRPGRVGDTPLIGCGTYADGAGAASATGPGETIIRAVMSRDAVDRLRGGAQAERAAQEACAEVKTKTGGEVGIILVGATGPAGIAHASRRMSYATATDGGPTVSGVDAGRVV